VSTTEATIERTLLTGGDPDEPYPIPIFSSDFVLAPELEKIGSALIAHCEEFEDIVWAIDEECCLWSTFGKRRAPSRTT
jgi:hypothetical protein